MKKLCPVFIGILLCAVAGAAEEGFNRIAVDRKSGRLTTEAAVRYFAQTVQGGDLHVFTPQVSLGYTLGNHGFETRLPLTFALYSGDSEAINSFSHGFEDLRLSYDYSVQNGHRNFTFGGFWGLPLNARGEPEAGSPIAPGSGRHGLGLSFSAHGIRDPAVWNLGFSYGIGLPGDGSGSTWEPGNIGLNAGLTVLFNEVFGFRINLHQELRLPQVGGTDMPGFGTATFFAPEALVLGEDWFLRVRLDLFAHPMFAPTALGITYGRTFDFSAKR